LAERAVDHFVGHGSVRRSMTLARAGMGW
jgi:hypothetical protein